jgi:hypothetical protein
MGAPGTGAPLYFQCLMLNYTMSYVFKSFPTESPFAKAMFLRLICSLTSYKHYSYLTNLASNSNNVILIFIISRSRIHQHQLRFWTEVASNATFEIVWHWYCCSQHFSLSCNATTGLGYCCWRRMKTSSDKCYYTSIAIILSYTCMCHNNWNWAMQGLIQVYTVIIGQFKRLVLIATLKI